MNTFDFQVRHTSCVCRITKYIGKIKSNTTCLMVLLLICSYIASLNDMFRPFHGPSSGWSIFARQKWVIIRLIIFCKAKLSHLQVDHFLQGKIESSSGWLFFARQKWVIFRLITFARQNVINLKMACARAETYRWEKLCENILVIKPLNKLCLTLFYRYILWIFMSCLEELNAAKQ